MDYSPYLSVRCFEEWHLIDHTLPLSPHIHCTGVAKDALKDAEAQLAAVKTKAAASNKALSAAQQKVSAADSALGTTGKSLKQAEDKLAQRTKQVQKETKIAAEKKKKADKKAAKVSHHDVSMKCSWESFMPHAYDTSILTFFPEPINC